MAIFHRFSKTFRENPVLAKAKNVFTIGGDLVTYAQAKSGNGLNSFSAPVANGRNKGKVMSPFGYFSLNETRSKTVTCGNNTAKNVAAQQGSYLTNSAKNLGRHCFHTFRYNNFGLFAPLGAAQTTAQLPGYARFYRRGEKPKQRFPERNKNIRDHKKRLLCAKFELKRNLYKALYRDADLPMALRMKAREKLTALPKNSSFTRVRNRCVLTARPRAIIHPFKMSRICFRDSARKGELMGIKKASW